MGGRTGVWLHRGLLLVCVLAGTDLAWIGASIAGLPGPALAGWLPVWTSLALSSAACLLCARKAPGLDPAARRFWRQFGLVIGLLDLATVSNYRDSGHTATTVGPVTLLCYSAIVLLAVWAMLRLPMGVRTRTEWLTLLLDGSLVMCSATLVAWRVAVGYASGASLTRANIAPVLGIIAVGFTGVLAPVKMALTSQRLVDRRALWALGGAVLGAAGAGVLAPLLQPWPQLNDTMLSGPLAALGVALAVNLQYRRAGGAGAHRGPAGPRRAGILPYVAVGATDALMVLGARHSGGGNTAIVYASVVLTALVMIRQLVAIHENRHLVRRLDATVLELTGQERRFRSLVLNSSDVILIVDGKGLFTYVSPGLERSLGLRPEQWLGRLARDVLHPGDLPMIDRVYTRMGVPGASVSLQARLRHQDGSWRWFDITMTDLRHDPTVGGVVGNARDITDTRQVQDQLAYQASHDELTGLANRALLRTRTAAAVRAGPCAVALVDLDDFKGVNDRLGHAVGDDLLRVVAERLRDCVRPGDLVARLGGDEFALLLRDIDGAGAAQIAQRVVTALGSPIMLGDHELLVQASIGLASSAADEPPDAGADDLLRRADMAMYAAKERGKGRYASYDTDLEARQVEDAELAGALSQALPRGELSVVYQPIVELITGRLASVEALLRWRHDGAYVALPRFIPVAERTGQVVGIGAWVLRTACAQAADWRRRYGPDAPARVAVNVSARQLAEPEFPDLVAEVVTSTGLPAGALTVEITETALFRGGQAVRAVAALKDLGIRIALDDFGTGHSSLGLLRTCPVDVLKVDKSFVDGVTGTAEQEAIAVSIVEIAQALRLTAIAEGVETPAQANRLQQLGYRLGQGFLFGRPVPAAELERCFGGVLPTGGQMLSVR